MCNAQRVLHQPWSKRARRNSDASRERCEDKRGPHSNSYVRARTRGAPSSHGHLHRDLLVRVVAGQLEVGGLETVDVRDRRVDPQRRERPGVVRSSVQYSFQPSFPR